MDILKRTWRALPGRRQLAALSYFVWGTDARYAHLWRRDVPGLFQPFATTRIDRYPDLFRFARDQLGDGPALRLLSFGCATGEEVFSLRRYFPLAHIRGIDINPRNIARCRAKLSRQPDPHLSFATAGDGTGEGIGRYDAVFAMAVYRHGDLCDHPPCCDHRIRFAAFAQSTAALAACLKPGGLLILRHANFRFADTPAASGFVPLLDRARHPTTAIYGPDERLLVPQPATECVVFRKNSALGVG